MRAVKLSIIEPWKYGTEKPIDASIVGKENEQYLIHLSNPVKIEDKEAHYFIAELRDKESVDDINTADSGEYLLNMVYSEDVSESNFGDYRIEEFRSGFLLGEVTLF